MSNKKNRVIDLESLDKAALDREKVILEIKNLTDAGQSPIEIFMKRRIIPVFLPFLTLLVTIIFFCINWRGTEKSKALDRYKSEVDMVKMVWADMNGPDTTKKYKRSKEFLIGMFNANSGYYKNDSIYLGIGKNQRPIMILTNMNSDIQKAFAKIEKNNELVEAIDKVPVTSKSNTESAQTNNTGKTVLLNRSPEIIEATNKVAGNSLKVYIQYTGVVGKDRTQFLASQLKPYYIVPPLDFVGSKEDENEIRYYATTNIEVANLLAKRIKDMTGLIFTLKKINNTTIHNTIEVWYCSTKTISTQ
ncbi:hypothetical protein [Flavobacterium sp. ASV13]|uniref:hypothetical protein n=1 Tax=Flavobacterium sp. ASV13 TaxID=1506583 RepID=UPI00054D1C08|nr:hypothetical protein [Flavobacterium sp. ASV13]